MTDFLLDTNIVVHLLRGGATYNRILTQVPSILGAQHLTSRVVFGECSSLVMQLNWSVERQRSLHGLLAKLIIIEIHPEKIIECYAELDYQSRKLGNKMGKNDLWIAASAKVADATLLTCDADFDALARAGALDVLKVV